MTENKPNPHDLTLAKEYAELLKIALGDNLVSVTLFCSRARGDAKEGSDYDLIIEVKNRTPEIKQIVRSTDVKMMNKYNALFVGFIFTHEEWCIEQKMPLGWQVAEDRLSL